MRAHSVIVSSVLSTIIAVTLLPVTVSAQAPPFITAWGSYGTGDGQFRTPVGVATDAAGDVYVIDSGNNAMGNRVQKFTSSGGYILQWGSPGPGIGQFDTPGGLALDPSGNVYVADTNNNRIQKFAANGLFLTTWGGLGSGDGQVYRPSSIAVDASGHVFVADQMNRRVQVFTDEGTYLYQWAMSDGLDGVAVDAIGNVYITSGSWIRKFSSSGSLLAAWGGVGAGNGQFSGATRLAIDGVGHVYVVDHGNDRIQVFTDSGAFIYKWGTTGTMPGQFLSPIGVAVDRSGNVYVADTNNSRIQKFGFAPTPTTTSTWGRIKELYR